MKRRDLFKRITAAAAAAAPVLPLDKVPTVVKPTVNPLFRDVFYALIAQPDGRIQMYGITPDGRVFDPISQEATPAAKAQP